MRRAGPAWLAIAVVGTAAVAWLLLSPPDATPAAPTFPGADKLYHAAMFGALGVAWGLATRRRPLVVFVALAAFAVATELAQLPLPGRSADARDALADLLGATLVFATGRRSPT